MSDSPLVRVGGFGQSVWLDLIRRGMLVSGELARLVEQDGVRGVTSNPAIFHKAIAETHDYDDAIAALAARGKSAEEIYRGLTVDDVRRAADILRPVYDATNGYDGYVSLEVSPHVAYDTVGAVGDARVLWSELNRPNAVVKVPATRDGLPAIRQLIDDGINVNVTLLFGLPRYREVAEAFIAGLEDRAARHLPLDRVASVASFFLSRIDVVVDPMLQQKAAAGGEEGRIAGDLVGKVAIASAKVAYQVFKEIFGGERFHALAEQGARVQRLLWASTSTKNPAYPDLMYVEPLIGPDTVNTLPLETLNAYRDHGNPAARLEENVEDAYRVLERLAAAGIDIDAVTQRLEDEGVEKFVTPFDQLMDVLQHRCTAATRAKAA